VLLGTSIAWFALDVAFYGINLNSSIVIEAIGFAGNIHEDKPSRFITRNCLGSIIINILGSVPGYWITMFTIEKLGRKTIQLMGFGILTVLYAILGFAYSQILSKSTGAFIFLFSLAQLFQNFGPNVTTFVIPGEVFPTRFRSTAHGISAAAGKFGAIVAQGGFLQLTDVGGKNNWINHLLQIFGAFMLLGFFVTFWIPESKGKTLEEICDESEDTEAKAVYELCPIEGSKGTFKILQYSLVYRDSRSTPADPERDNKWLSCAFDCLTKHYDIALGHCVQLPDRNVIVVDQEDRDKQRFFSHSEPQLSVDEFNKIRYRRDMWPPALDLLLSSRTKNTECLISAVAVHLQDGLLITLSVSHIIADAAGVAILLQQWASIAAQLLESKERTCGLLLPKLRVDYDHPAFWKSLKSHLADTHPYVNYIDQQNYGDLHELQAKVATLYKTGSLDGEQALAMRVIYLSESNIAKIAQKFNKADGSSALHGVQVFYALLWQRYVAAALHTSTTEVSPQDTIFLNILHNVRGLVSADSYVGNGVSTVYVPSTIGEILQLPTIELAIKIKSLVNTVTPGAAVHLAEAISNPDSTFALKAIHKYSLPASHMTISNASRMPFYETDFGLGKPLAVLWGTRPTDTMSSWLPHSSAEGEGGIDIYFGMRDSIYDALKADKLL
ncbi:hypothetical protein H4R20_005515, partial [Coemansia guatemalensis]